MPPTRPASFALARVESLGDRFRPLFGQVSLWAFLAVAVVLSTRIWGWSLAERGHPASILGWLPDRVVSSPALFAVLRAAFWGGAVLWALRLLVPFSSWMATTCYLASMSLYLENYPNAADHTKHFVGMLLVVYALWYHLYRREIRDASRRGTFWTSDLFPRWVHSLSLFYLGLAYTLAGLMKWIYGGLGWANGLSIQLWVSLMGDPSSAISQWILADRGFARLSQAAGLAIESSGILGFLVPALRIPIGLAVIGFHVVNEAVFHFDFGSNIVLVALVFLPVFEWTACRRRLRAG